MMEAVHPREGVVIHKIIMDEIAGQGSNDAIGKNFSFFSRLCIGCNHFAIKGFIIR